MADVVILGGGPAGAAAAADLARSGARVVVLERATTPSVRPGDTLAPDAAVWLGRLGLAEAVARVPQVPSPGVVSLWDGTEPTETDFVFGPHGDGRHLDRAAFDAALLAAAAAAGAEVRRGVRVRECRRAGVGWLVRAAGMDLTARWLIDATGRAAWLVRRLGVTVAAHDRLVAVLGRTADVAADRRLVVEAVPDGWWYFAPLPGGRGVAAWLTDADLLPRDSTALAWQRSLASTRLIAARAGGAVGPLQVVPAGVRVAARAAGPGWLAVGDAALAHDPLSGSGLSQALAMAWHAADTTRAALTGDAAAPERYADWLADTAAQYTATRADYYQRVRHWPGEPFWRRRA